MLNTGDTAWVLAAAALVMLMTRGLAFFCGGMVRSNSDHHHVWAGLMTRDNRCANGSGFGEG